ncbi:MAG: 16S rRNA processing protein RimM [Nitrospirae bacterium]|nr:16S rRNA processing protein RimM [Nitrospirota bacterium]
MGTVNTGIDPGTDKDFVSVAYIVRPHGLKGEVKVVQLSNDPERIYSLRDIFIIRKNGEKRKSVIKKVRPVKSGFAVSLEDITTVTDAQQIVGSYIAVPQDDVPVLGKDSWYHFEIIGMEVFTTEGMYLGMVEDIISTGSNDVYILRDKDREYLIPAIRDVIKDVDVKGRRMVIALMDGLI